MAVREFRCAAILFDLDGVLVDSTRSVARQWKLWAKENNLDPERLLEIAHGRRTIEVVQLLTPHLASVEEVQKIEAREAADTDGVHVMRGAVELVGSIPPKRWAVVTSGTRYLAMARLRLGKIPVPEVLIAADDVINGKPHPEPYLKGAERLGIGPQDCLVIEDAPAGIAAAHAGGMRVVALTSTYPASELKDAEAIVSDLTELRLEHDDTQSSALKIRITSGVSRR
jgi:mannitol-1-/sugar-/sorbitol-6-phosphatase